MFSNPSASASEAALNALLLSLRLRDSIPFPPSPLCGGPPGDMPIPLRSIGCLPVVASLLPPGTRLTALSDGIPPLFCSVIVGL